MDKSVLAQLGPAEKRALLAKLLQRQAGSAAPGTALSHGQRALWFLHRLAPESAAYNLHFCAHVRSALNPSVLRLALSNLVARHESLRATFVERPDGPTQVSGSADSVELISFDVADCSDDELDRRLHVEAHRPFDLVRGPLFRACLFSRRGDRHVLLVSVHHIVSDHWTLGVLMEEVREAYPALNAGRPVALAAPARTYGDFIAWQRDLLASEEGNRLWEYWRAKLAGELPALNLPTDRPRPAVQTDRGATHRFGTAPALTRRLRELARSEGATLFAVLLAGYQAFLHRLTGQNDILVGSPVANRGRPEFSRVVGYLVNMLVYRADVGSRDSFRRLLGQVRQTVRDALDHQEFPFALLVERLQPARDLSRPPLFQTAFVLNRAHQAPRATANGDPGSHLDFGGLMLEPVALDQRAVQFDWNLMAEESGDHLAWALQYNADLFDAATIERWMGHFVTFLAGLADDPDQPISRVPLLDNSEARQRLAAGCGPTVRRPDVGLHQLIERQSAQTPDAVALMLEGRSLNYGEVNRRANRLANRLRAMGVAADAPVPVVAERSFEMVIGLLAAMKAGGAYVPLDPELPRERLAFLLDDLAPPVVLTQARLSAHVPTEGRAVLRLDADAALWDEEPDGDLGLPVAADQLAYIIYTSGSTGQPKGCMNTHRGIVNRLLWMQEEYGLTPSDRVLQKTPYSFDVSVWEFFWPLLAGARLVIARPGGHKDPAYLAQLIADERVTVLHFVPSMLSAFLQADGLHRCGSLRHVICSGEALSWDLQEQFAATLSARLHNLYGPTEAAVDVTYWACDRGDPRKIVPIGRPIANTVIHILDGDLQPVPVGVPGELHIGGVNLARGYWKRPELTAEKFIADPFRIGERLYKTGDLARFLADGSIEYLGRLDHQVKIRGFRIELGEIEAALVRHAAVAEATVLARTDAGSPRLVAYIVPRTGTAPPSAAELRSFLAGKLPEYMVPAAFVPVAALPLSANGKVDRKALPAPSADRPELASAFVAPATPTEQRLAVIWSDVLQMARVGRQDGFFDLGGHSLLATQVIARVRTELGVDLPLRRLFESATLADFAAAIDQQRGLTDVTGSDGAALRPVPRDQPLPLSFGQETLWFLDQLEPGNTSYNCPAAVRLTGRLNLEALRRAFEMIIHRHESLRTTFARGAHGPVVVINPPSDLALAVHDLTGLPAHQRERQADALIAAEARTPFDLSRAPLLRLSVLRLAANENTVLMTVHHIAYDGWSTGVLVHEFTTLYRALSEGRTPALPPLKIQYQDYAHWQRQRQRDGKLDADLAYWTRQLAGVPPLLNLPTDRPRPRVWTFAGDTLPLRFPPELVAGLRALGRRQGCTLFMTMLSAFQTLLYRYSGQDDVCVGSPIANRNHVETEGLIAYVVNTLVLRGNLAGNPTFLDLMRRNREMALGAYSHQDLPFERLMQELHPSRDVRHSSLFQVLFVLQNAPVDIPPLPGLTPRLLLDRHNGTAKFDLTLGLTDMPEGLIGMLEYNTDLFDRATVERMAVHFRRLLEEAVHDPSRPIDELPLLNDDEQAWLLARGRGQHVAGDVQRCLHHLFERWAAERPDAPALVVGDVRLSYGELNRRANRLAHYLRRRGVGPERIVGLSTEKSAETIIGTLGILKAGGAYLPLDPALPRDRLAVVLNDARPALVLTQQRLAADLPCATGEVLCLDADTAPWAGEKDTNPESGVGPHNLCYVIYTSGSTGTPKGVMVEHAGVVNAFDGWEAAYGLSRLNSFLAMANFAFDVFTGDWVRAIGSGGKLVICPTESLLEPEQVLALMRWEQTDYVECVPAVMRPLLRHLEATGQTLEPAKLVVCGADAWYGGEFRRLRRVLPPGGRLMNSYGLTEATIDNTFYDGGDEGLAEDGPIPIGRPYANQTAYVLDAHLRPQPVGVPGELYVGGAGVARGYLNRPELTAEKFIPDPFHASGRLYKSGDLARMLPSGELEWLGRTDHQVKVRGFRIELGEIEATLAQHPAVAEAAVTARDEARGVKRLVAYVVAAENQSAPPSAAELRTFLAGKLPEYMVPAAFVPLAALPLNANGKVDRKALPAPEAGRLDVTSEYVAPTTPTEQKVAALWADILHVERVGARDNFFELGGHSLLATHVIARVKGEFGVELPLRKVFEAATLADFAAALDSQNAQDRSAGDGIDWWVEAVLDTAITAKGLASAGAQPPRRILLTGATGFLGAFLLDDLLRDTDAEIVCLVRAGNDADARQRVRHNLAQYDLDVGERAGRITALPGDLAQPRFGLSEPCFAQLAESIDAICHNGAQVHFLHPYESLKAANVGGTREVLRLATTARLKPVQFVSTLSVLAHSGDASPALEDDRNDHPELLANGYAQSKWVAERLVWAAIERGVPATIVRPGRIVWHSRTGALNLDDLFTRALRACIQLRSVPALDVLLEMTPVDFVSRAAVQIAWRPATAGRAFHLFNGRFVPLRQLLDWVRAAGYPLEELPPERWVQRIQEAATHDVQDALAGLVPLLANGVPHFDDAATSTPKGPGLDGRNARAALAGTGVESPPITAESVARYLARLSAAGQLAAPAVNGRGALNARPNGRGDRFSARSRTQGAK